MPKRIKAGLASVALLSLLALVAYDARTHFDADLIELKRQVDSPQRHWSLFYSQSNVYQNSSIRYANDLASIAKLIENDSIVLSDRASSYYLAAETRAFVKNIHRHHGGNREAKWSRLIGRQNACFPDRPERHAQFTTFVQKQQAYAKRQGRPRFSYILVNHDRQNRNLRKSCLAARHGTLNKEYSGILPTVFSGEYLTLYSLNEIN
ncbi:MAG: hypothetical protein ACI9FB_001370 [Candidatus Azotimanducaceae bacterium]|jgi:hypothetical protein